MITDAFRNVGEASADERGRLPIGKTGVRKDDRYSVAVNDEGQILLTPLVSIPRRELILWENLILRESLARGLAEIADGKTVDLGSFAEYASDIED